MQCHCDHQVVARKRLVPVTVRLTAYNSHICNQSEACRDHSPHEVNATNSRACSTGGAFPSLCVTACFCDGRHLSAPQCPYNLRRLLSDIRTFNHHPSVSKLALRLSTNSLSPSTELERSLKDPWTTPATIVTLSAARTTNAEAKCHQKIQYPTRMRPRRLVTQACIRANSRTWLQ